MNAREQLHPAAPSRGLIDAACPICRSQRRKQIYPGTISPERMDAFEGYSYDVLPSEHHPIVACLDCGVKYASPRDKSEVLARVYGGGGTASYMRLAEGKLASFRQEAALLKSACKSPGKLLEIGCATGLFLRAAGEAGFSVEGCEPWREAAAIAQREFGDRVKAQMFVAGEYEAESYDVVAAWDVIEHVEDPVAIVRDAYRLLVPGGWLAITTPNYGSMSRRVLGSRWQFFERPHLVFFEPTTLSKLLETAGFHDIRASSLRKTCSVAYVAGYLEKWSRLLSRTALAGIRCIKPLEKLNVRLPIGGMRVLARKPLGATP